MSILAVVLGGCNTGNTDGVETDNRCSALSKAPLTQAVRDALEQILAEQRRQKRLLPKTLNRDAGEKGPLRD
jgi:hypothetical protein